MEGGSRLAVIPAEAGIQLDSRFRGSDAWAGMRLGFSQFEQP
jgi:hypothetical protein